MASFLIPTIAFTLLICLISPAPTLVAGAVIDVDGDIVPNGGLDKFYMLPYENPIGAGPIGWINKTNSCPLYVTKQALTEYTRFSTVTLSSPYLSLFIPVGGPIFIRFNDENTPCEKPLTWFVSPAFGLDVHFLELAAGKTSVFPIGLVIEDAKIKGEYVYKLKFCQYVNEDGGPCYPIVEKPDNSGLLGVVYNLPNNDVKPFQFQLAKAKSSFLKMKMTM